MIMDIDLQDPPELMGEFLSKWKEGFKVVYGVRTKRKENIFKKLAYSVFYRALKFAAKIDIPLDAGGFCLMDREVVRRTTPSLPRWTTASGGRSCKNTTSTRNCRLREE